MISQNLVISRSRDPEYTERPAFERSRLEYEAAADAARGAIFAMTSMRQRMLDLNQRKAAACADAETARIRWSRLLRESGGVLTTDLEDLRASERSSLSLADEYQAMCEELETSLISSEVSAADLAATALSKRRVALSAAAEDAFVDLQMAIGPSFEHAYRLFQREQAESMPPGERHSDKEALMAFVSRFSALILQNSSPTAQQTYESIGISELKVEDIPHELLHSPVRRSMLRELSKNPA
ncbi:hypothetical protein PDM28_16795 [Stenotrophomonas aracearum]|jgi:hypothetical protein|uniref:Uncharacterized protein n=1 Tax=Stenotrophomonas aracearum TaxID=3003272 RepID=A0ABY9YC72_9GAMM|nr:hypothetical protein [Stenotrophomonas sp. A5588]WNH48303.1 hypothetical protein PDM28_16795 [Stenotrophomonas sp. A5588]